MKQSRLKSKVVWVTITTALLLVVAEWGLYEKVGIEQEQIQHSIDFVLLVLISFGVLNDPTTKENF